MIVWISVAALSACAFAACSDHAACLPCQNSPDGCGWCVNQQANTGACIAYTKAAPDCYAWNTGCPFATTLSSTALVRNFLSSSSSVRTIPTSAPATVGARTSTGFRLATVNPTSAPTSTLSRSTTANSSPVPLITAIRPTFGATTTPATLSTNPATALPSTPQNPGPNDTSLGHVITEPGTPLALADICIDDTDADRCDIDGDGLVATDYDRQLQIFFVGRIQIPIIFIVSWSDGRLSIAVSRQLVLSDDLTARLEITATRNGSFALALLRDVVTSKLDGRTDYIVYTVTAVCVRYVYPTPGRTHYPIRFSAMPGCRQSLPSVCKFDLWPLSLSPVPISSYPDMSASDCAALFAARYNETRPVRGRYTLSASGTSDCSPDLVPAGPMCDDTSYVCLDMYSPWYMVLYLDASHLMRPPTGPMTPICRSAPFPTSHTPQFVHTRHDPRFQPLTLADVRSDVVDKLVAIPIDSCTSISNPDLCQLFPGCNPVWLVNTSVCLMVPWFNISVPTTVASTPCDLCLYTGFVLGRPAYLDPRTGRCHGTNPPTSIAACDVCSFNRYGTCNWSVMPAPSGIDPPPWADVRVATEAASDDSQNMSPSTIVAIVIGSVFILTIAVVVWKVRKRRMRC